MQAVNKSSIPKSASLEKMGEFWGTHDFTEFDNSSAPVTEFTVTCAIPIELDLLSVIERYAQQHGVSAETLVNLWLQQKVAEQKTA